MSRDGRTGAVEEVDSVEEVDTVHTVDDACGSCILQRTRRDFVRDSIAIAIGAIAAIGGARPVGAVTTAWVEGRTSSERAGSSMVSYPVPVSNGVSIDRKNEVVLTRWNNVVYAFSLSCPHQKTALRWIEGDTRFQCPKHKSKYQPDGTFISGKATRGMDRYSLHRDGSTIVVDTSSLHKQDADPTGWAAAMVKLDGEK
jgi:Rieske Fe-S protein